MLLFLFPHNHIETKEPVDNKEEGTNDVNKEQEPNGEEDEEFNDDEEEEPNNNKEEGPVNDKEEGPYDVGK